MPKPGDDIKTEPLYEALAALGTRHRSMRPEVLKRYGAILKAPEVLRRAGRRTSFDLLAAAAHAAIIVAVREIRDDRLNDIAHAVMCASDEYEGAQVKERIGALERKWPTLDRDVYKYSRLVVLDRIYQFLTQKPSADNNWLSSVSATAMHPAGWEVSPDLLPTLGRLRYRAAQLHYGALGTTFVARFNDRLTADAHLAVKRRPDDNRWPVAGDLFFGPCVRFAVARDEFERRFASWRTTYTTVWQETRLGSLMDMIEAFRAPMRDELAAWAVTPIAQHIKASESGPTSIEHFYTKTWLPWLRRTLPRYATAGYNYIEYNAHSCWQLLNALDQLFGAEQGPTSSARVEVEETVTTYYREVSRAIVVDGKPIGTVASEYLQQRAKKYGDDALVWHRINIGSGRKAP